MKKKKKVSTLLYSLISPRPFTCTGLFRSNWYIHKTVWDLDMAKNTTKLGCGGIHTRWVRSTNSVCIPPQPNKVVFFGHIRVECSFVFIIYLNIITSYMLHDFSLHLNEIFQYNWGLFSVFCLIVSNHKHPLWKYLVVTSA